VRELKPPPFLEELEADLAAAAELPPVEPAPEQPPATAPGPDWRSLPPWERAAIRRNQRIRAGLARWKLEHPPEPPSSIPMPLVVFTEPPHWSIENYYYRVLP